MMCDEKEALTVTYKVMRRHGKRLRPTGRSRTAPAVRTTGHKRWHVHHNTEWKPLGYSERLGWYIEVSR